MFAGSSGQLNSQCVKSAMSLCVWGGGGEWSFHGFFSLVKRALFAW